MRLSIATLECLGILLILSTIAILGGSKFTDWSASFAVFLGFIYAQRSFDIAEQMQPHAVKNESPIDLEMKRIFVLKEFVWMTTFYAIGSYPLLCGACVFAMYPSIRRYLRQDLFMIATARN